MTTSTPTPEQLASIILTGNENNAEAMTVTGGGRKNLEIQYWRMCPSDKYPNCSRHRTTQDYIITGPAMSPLSAIQYTEFQMVKHAEPLPQSYGRQEAGDMWKAATRYNQLITNGGIKEFPIRQMIEYGWHLLPLVVSARPELATAVTMDCPHGCQRRHFYGVNETEARFLMDKHIRAIHKDTVAPIAIGREITKAVEAVAGAKTANIDPVMIAQIVAATMAAMEQNKVSPQQEVSQAMLEPTDNIPADSVLKKGK